MWTSGVGVLAGSFIVDGPAEGDLPIRHHEVGLFLGLVVRSNVRALPSAMVRVRRRPVSMGIELPAIHQTRVVKSEVVRRARRQRFAVELLDERVRHLHQHVAQLRRDPEAAVMRSGVANILKDTRQILLREARADRRALERSAVSPGDGGSHNSHIAGQGRQRQCDRSAVRIADFGLAGRRLSHYGTHERCRGGRPEDATRREPGIPDLYGPA
jgi:hypothetical protein